MIVGNYYCRDSEIHEAVVERFGDGVAVEVLTDEHQFLLTVAVRV